MKIISIILSICLIYSTTYARTYIYNMYDININSQIKELEKKYPNAKFIALTPEEYKEFIKKHKSKDAIFLSDKYKYTPDSEVDNYTSDSQIDDFYIPNFCGGNGNDVCIYILIIVASVVVAILIFEGLVILSDVITSDKELGEWFEMGITGSYFPYENQKFKDVIYGGVIISGGLIEKYNDIGFISEFGHINLYLQDNYIPENRIGGAYGLFGPTFRYFFKSKKNFYLDLMAGMTDLKYINMMEVARVGVNSPLGKHGFLDINLGVNHLRTKKITHGYIDNKNGTYNPIFGVSFNYSF